MAITAKQIAIGLIEREVTIDEHDNIAPIGWWADLLTTAVETGSDDVALAVIEGILGKGGDDGEDR